MDKDNSLLGIQQIYCVYPCEQSRIENFSQKLTLPHWCSAFYLCAYSCVNLSFHCCPNDALSFINLERNAYKILYFRLKKATPLLVAQIAIKLILIKTKIQDGLSKFFAHCPFSQSLIGFLQSAAILLKAVCPLRRMKINSIRISIVHFSSLC